MVRKTLGPAGRVAQAFINSKLTPLLVLVALAIGVFAVLITPREEEPQIKVPMIDVLVPFPGASAREVEERVATPLEKLVWEIPGVEYVYTTSSPNFAMAIVRFKVGEDPEQSLVKLYTKMMAHPERIPPGAGPRRRQAEVDRRRPDHGADPLEPRARRVPAAPDRRRGRRSRSRRSPTSPRSR